MLKRLLQFFGYYSISYVYLVIYKTGELWYAESIVYSNEVSALERERFYKQNFDGAYISRFEVLHSLARRQ